MDCRECRDKLSLYLDGQLTETERVRVEAELERCPDCAREFEQLSLMVDDLRAIGAARAPDPLLADLKAAFRAELARESRSEPRAPGFFRHFGPWRSLAASLLLALTIFVVARDRGLFDAMPKVMEQASNEDSRLLRPGGEIISPGASAPAEGAGLKSGAEDEVWEAEEGEDLARDDDEAPRSAEREERHLRAWRGFLDHVGGEVRKRGLDLVESRAETEGYLSGFGFEPTPASADKFGGDLRRGADGKDAGASGSRGAIKGERQEEGRVKGEPKAGAAPLRSPERSYFLMGEGALAALEEEAKTAAAAVLLSPIVRLDPAAKKTESGGVEAQIELPVTSAEALVARLAKRSGLDLRLFARRPAPDSRPAEAADEEAKLLLLFILPRP